MSAAITRGIAGTSLVVGERTQKMPDDELAWFLEVEKPELVVNLWHTADPRVRARVPAYRHVPIPDGRVVPSTIPVVEAAAEEVGRLASAGRPVYLHCYGGRNRSMLVAAVAMVRYLGWESNAAIDACVLARASALKNAHFVEYIRRLA